MIVAEPLPALRDPPHGTPAPARPRHGSHTRIRARTRVTPARLRVMALGLAVLALVVGLVTALAADNRHTATSAALQTAEPLVVEAQAIDTYLSDADTTAAGSFLQGQIQPASLRSRYMTDLARASASLAGAAQAAGGDPAVAVDHPVRGRQPPDLRRTGPDGDVQRAPGLLPARRGLHRRGQQSDAGRDPPGGHHVVCRREPTIGERPGQRGERAVAGGRRPLHRCCSWCCSSWCRSG